MTKVVILTGWIIAGSIILFIIILLAIPVVITFDYGDDIRLRVRYLFITIFRIPQKPKKPKKEKVKKEKKQKPEKSAKSDAKAVVTAENTGAPARTTGTPAQAVSTAAKPSPESTAGESRTSAEDKPSDKKEDSSDKDKKKKEKGPKEKNPNMPTLPEIFELVKVFVDSLKKPLKKLLKRIKICDLDIDMVCGGEDAAAAALNFGRMNLLIGNAFGFLDTFFKLKRPHAKIDVAFDSEETTARCSCTVKMNALTALAFAFTFLGRLIVRALRSSKIKGYIGRIRGNSADKKADKKSRKKIAKKIRKDKNK